MTRNYLLPLLLALLLATPNVKATTWETVSQGYWSSGYTWLGGVPPPYISGDTIILKHPVIFEQNLGLGSGAYLKIDSAGGLCGHHNVSVHTGALVLKQGILELDSLYVPGGVVTCIGPGEVIITCQGQLTNGGQMTVNGCQLSVGPWFNCRLPEYSFALGIPVSGKGAISLFPNPCGDRLTLSGIPAVVESTLMLKDAAGRMVRIQSLSSKTGQETIRIHDLPTGLYYWELITDSALSGRGKLIVMP